jgi:hypothetical protein
VLRRFGFQVSFTEKRAPSDGAVATIAVGLILNGKQAEQIVQRG